MTIPTHIKSAVLALALAAALPAADRAWAHEYETGGVSVVHPWARATPGGAKVGAVFMEIKAKEGADDALVSASTPAAGRVEIHTHTMDNGVMKMRRIEKLPVAGGKSSVLKPGGDHIMLFDLKAPLKEGELLPLTLVFEKGGSVTIDASIEPVGAKGPHGMDHQPGHEAGGSGDHDAQGSH